MLFSGFSSKNSLLLPSESALAKSAKGRYKLLEKGLKGPTLSAMRVLVAVVIFALSILLIVGCSSPGESISAEATDYLESAKDHIDAREYDEALDDLDKAAEISPNSAEVYLERGVIYAIQAQYNLALDDLNRSVELDPSNEDAYYAIGLTYRELGRYEEAIAAYNKALEIFPDNAWVYFTRGLTYYEWGDNDVAITDFKHALQIDPNLQDAKDLLRILGEPGY